MGRKHKASGRSRGPSEAEEIAAIEAALQTTIDPETLKRFEDYPLSRRTKEGLRSAGYTVPTDIQQQGLLKGLQGRDVLGAAKTGSGKTLAFLVPVLERLYRLNWTKLDGVGALIISPTKELALQTFNCLRKIGAKHQFSAGLVVGGTSVDDEQAVITSTNIIICTPGRLLHHMDETPAFNCDNLKILVLDEADRILDLGFSATLNAIIENLPTERQTLLYSATQTATVSALARLSLSHPDYVSAHQNAKTSTPLKLVQAYMIVPLHQKLDMLYSFLRSHTQNKILVFVSSCKQVRFIYETFRRLRPGVPLMQLYGKQKLAKRIAVFEDFKRKEAAVLFATDIAARGLDIPAVQWVVQLDCPEDTDTYIHRVGRTARYDRDGKALLLLAPSEQRFVDLLLAKKVPITETEANLTKVQSIRSNLQAQCAEEPSLKYLGQKCFISYMRSVFLQSNKEVFRFDKLPIEDFALSLGLPAAPRIKFSKQSVQKAVKAYGPSKNGTASGNQTRTSTRAPADQKLDPPQPNQQDVDGESDDDDDDDDADDDSEDDNNVGDSDNVDDNDDTRHQFKAAADRANLANDLGKEDDAESQEDEEWLTAAKTKQKTAAVPRFERLRRRVNQDVLSDAFQKLRRVDDESTGDVDDLLQKAPVQRHEALNVTEEQLRRPPNKKERKQKQTLAAVRRRELDGLGQRVVFDEEGEALVQGPKLVGFDMAEKKVAQLALKRQQAGLQDAARDMTKADELDREIYRQRIHDRKKALKLKQRALRQQASQQGTLDGVGAQLAVLGGADDDDDGDEADFGADGELDGVTVDLDGDPDFALLDEAVTTSGKQNRRDKGAKSGKKKRAVAMSSTDDDTAVNDLPPARKVKRSLQSLEDEALSLLAA